MVKIDTVRLGISWSRAGDVDARSAQERITVSTPRSNSLNLILSSSAADHGCLDSEDLFSAMPVRELPTLMFCTAR